MQKDREQGGWWSVGVECAGVGVDVGGQGAVTN